MNYALDFIDNLPVARTRKRTFLEIMKVSNRETIMANLLAFYFQPSEEHGLGDLFIRALLNTPCYELNTHSKSDLPMDVSRLKSEKTLWAKVHTEDATDESKRIDIVIETDKVIIAIEFKINHTLNNPLDTYVEHIERQYPEEKPKYFLVLGPNWKQPERLYENGHKFQQVILSHFVQQIEILMDESQISPSDRNDQQYHYLKDFIRTIKNRKITFDMIKEYQDRAAENDQFEKKVNGVFRDLQKIQLEFESKMSEVNKKLHNFSIIESSKNNLSCVIEKKINNNTIKLRLRLTGWSLEQWIHKQKMEGKTIHFSYNTNTEGIIAEIKSLESQLD